MEYKYRCELPADTLARHAADPGAMLEDVVARTFAPLCTEPRLLYVAMQKDSKKTTIWPTFDPDYFGPYYTSLNEKNDFYLYTKGGTLSTVVQYTTDANGNSVNGELKMGEISTQIITFKDANTNVLKLDLKVFTKNYQLWGEKVYRRSL